MTRSPSPPAPSPSPSAAAPSRPEAATLRQLYVDEGLTVAGVARRLGVSTGAAHKWLRAAGVAMRPSPAEAVPVEDDTVRRLYVDHGWSAAEIATHVGCSVSTVFFRLRRLGVPSRPPRPRECSRPADAELRRLHLDEGLTLRQIATRFSVTRQAVWRWLTSAGIPPRPAPPRPAGDVEAVAELYDQGLSGLQIADRLGCSSATVYRRLDEAGINRRTRPPAVERAALLEALDAGFSAPDMAAAFGVSVAAVCRALTREGLQTASQATRRRAGDRYAVLLDIAESSDSAPLPTVAWLRRRVAPRPQHRPGTPTTSPGVEPGGRKARP